MVRLFSAIARSMVLASLALTIVPEQRGAAISRPEDGPMVSLPPVVRLRKLHLVRPDLIPYPIAYEVCC
jgi:hypothetical protein